MALSEPRGAGPGGELAGTTTGYAFAVFRAWFPSDASVVVSKCSLFPPE